MHDCLIVGGGVIGLSLAYELAGAGLSVQLLERGGRPGRETSWAGAGILPPRRPNGPEDRLGQLAQLSCELHPQWAAALQDETGVDTGLRRCGGLYLAHDAASAAALEQQAAQWNQTGIEAEPIDRQQLAALEPALCPHEAAIDVQRAYLLRDEYQLRNPRHLKALIAACRRRGVEIVCGQSVEEFVVVRGAMREVIAGGEPFRAGQFCLTAGSWSGALMRRLGLSIAVKPIRGQIVLLQIARPLIERVVNLGRRYLVPRPDGRVLAGSTEEDAGFLCHTTAAGVAGVLETALALVPQLRDAPIERSWAGLRPATTDGLPYLGPIPNIANAFVATGHFRAGIELSPATALVMSQLIRGESPQVNLDAFRLDRQIAESREPRAESQSS